MILDTVLVLSALCLLVYNQHRARTAEKASMDALAELVAQMGQNGSGEDPLDDLESTMDTLTVDGEEYIGYLTIPALGLELPVISEWSYPRMLIAPCRFTGTLGGRNLVIMAHSYTSHFGMLSELSPGDTVYFHDVHERITRFEVVATDILLPTAVEEMTAGDYDLTLFTCTYGGKNRVTVRCNQP